ncbi:tetratricopeptide repeat protein [Zobellia uliginosa]|uniref:tetratricopeptide repeat protein n=1 Tax=Zobellia uliginosa TaxID=143224 RepID=UPI0026E363B3|nr:tetratricopeptide repeat protein [Zobellia uliginosa]MDO6515954.1 tetratricopeptide repeat protein [Zobellia uliginosa]
MKHSLILVLFCIGFVSFAQEGEKERAKALDESRNLTWEANKALSEDNFIEAEADYRKAIAKSDENSAAPYNLGNAYYTKETYSEAFGRFKQAGELATDKADKHRAYHNMGNVFMKRKEYQKAIEAYKEALRNDPTDDETRYNLALAKKMLEKEQEQNDQNQDNKDQQDKNDQKDQNEDKKEGDNKEDNQDQDKENEGDKGDEGDENEEQKDENKEGEGDEKEEQKKQPEQGDKSEEQQQQPRPNQLSKQQIQNLLEAMQNEEKKVQEKIDAQKVKGVKVKNEKDW